MITKISALSNQRNHVETSAQKYFFGINLHETLYQLSLNIVSIAGFI